MIHISRRPKLKAKFLTLFLFMVVLSLYALPASAQLVPCGREDQLECTTCHIFELGQNIFNLVAQQIIPPVGMVLVVIAGGMIFLGGPKPELVKKGKDMLTAVVIGAAIFYGAWAITNTLIAGITKNFTESSLKQDWGNIQCGASPPATVTSLPDQFDISCISSPTSLVTTPWDVRFNVKLINPPTGATIIYEWDDLVCNPPDGCSGWDKSKTNSFNTFKADKIGTYNTIVTVKAGLPTQNPVVITKTCSIGPATGGLVCNVASLNPPSTCSDAGVCPDCIPLKKDQNLQAAKSLADMLAIIDDQFKAAGITYRIAEAMCPTARHGSCSHFNGHAVDLGSGGGSLNLENKLNDACKILNDLGFRGQTSIRSSDRMAYILEKTTPGGNCPSAVCGGASGACGLSPIHIQN
jgi:hypothetical protein